MTDKAKNRFAGDLRESAGRIWLAGLGALAAAEEEGGKLFRHLVERGESFETPGTVRTATRRAKDARSQAGSALGKVEEAFDQRLSSALHRIGVPTRREIEALSKRIENIQALIDAKAEKTAKPAKRKTAPRKATRKTVAAKTGKKKATKKTTGKAVAKKTRRKKS